MRIASTYMHKQVLSRYNEITPHIRLCGPTSFAPLINEAVRIVQRERTFHILVIIADGEGMSMHSASALHHGRPAASGSLTI
jgi:hypothetical protein